MSPKLPTASLAALSLVVLTTGCASRTYMGPPVYTVPGTTTLPPGGFAAPSGTVMPQQVLPSPGMQSAPQFPNQLDDAPVFDGNSSQAPADDNLVPVYPDPGLDEPAGDDQFEQPFGSSQDSPFYGEGAQAAPPASEAPGPVAEDEFLPPLKNASASREVTISRRELGGPDPYDYDRNGYKWLRGVVDFDQKSKSWKLLYNLRPDAKDQFGGSITLQQHLVLASLQRNDVVMVDGQVDWNSTDDAGKPLYAISELRLLTPKQ